jgi:hypothetical protein
VPLARSGSATRPGSRLRGDERGPHIDRPQPVRLLHRHLIQRPCGEDAGVIDQNIEPAEEGNGPVDGRGHSLGIGIVGPQDQRPAAIRVDLLADRLGLAGGVNVGQCHGGPLAG